MFVEGTRHDKTIYNLPIPGEPDWQVYYYYQYGSSVAGGGKASGT